MSKTVVVAIVVAAVLVAGATAAAIVTLTSKSLTITSQALTHGQCTVSGTAATSDAWTDEKNATTNNSGATMTAMSISPRTSNRKYGWLKFSFTSCSFPANSVVDSALLTLNVTTIQAGRTISVCPANGAWTASGTGAITWGTQPAIGSATTTFGAGTLGAVTVDVSSDVAGWVDGATANNGWALADLATLNSNIAAAVGSAENGTTGNRPSLQINYAY